ncbi:MAG: hypothetical protein M5U15_10245 [Kiritimatiellae bacterium]|nr:hypothetical protein [Kiritimatiellia bacterium]
MRTPEAEKTIASGMDPKRRERVSRLSLPEWALIGGVLLLILAAAIPAWAAWQQRERLVMARHDIATLQAAILRYHREYGTWPAEATTGGTDTRFGARRPNAALIRVLRSDLLQDDQAAELNPQRMIFIEVEPYRVGWSGLNSSGEFLDPWGVPYQLALDSNYDGSTQIEGSPYGRVSGVGALIWSYGPDRQPETPDDLVSWDRK